jgi:hypothetical protein
VRRASLASGSHYRAGLSCSGKPSPWTSKSAAPAAAACACWRSSPSRRAWPGSCATEASLPGRPLALRRKTRRTSRPSSSGVDNQPRPPRSASCRGALNTETPAANVPQRGASPADGLAVRVLGAARLAGSDEAVREAHWAFRVEECRRLLGPPRLKLPTRTLPESSSILRSRALAATARTPSISSMSASR